MSKSKLNPHECSIMSLAHLDASISFSDAFALVAYVSKHVDESVTRPYEIGDIDSVDDSESDQLMRTLFRVRESFHYVDFYVNTYMIDRAYGGREEGGWWYDAGHPLQDRCTAFQYSHDESVLSYFKRVQSAYVAAWEWADNTNTTRDDRLRIGMGCKGRYEV